MELLNDLKLAVDLEQRGFDYYTKTAGKTSNPLVVSTFNSLAERELLHLERAKSIYQNLTGQVPLPADLADKISISRAKLLAPILHHLKKGLAKDFSSTSDMNMAYKVAEEMEQFSYKLYDKINAEATDPLVKKFYAALALEEREHFAILQETLVYLNDPGEWYRQNERWIIEG
ncbi:hypothetical protein A2311_00475 [candidate division WOR-1 bacterium RIFOXYB2_FULL_48_7]|uniref:Rubrerythrin diiron-binding domain-containing protein n=1 Tax=candidate division WOR-1 bacterium RIFOXYB2_FULL_48_7 TaxID=1802583 RepID=A0A1F4TTT3_UNCSA|nr:MAG: hypothetical protein A2311_00475 [candidate division WOR-1 bacterium RIFOXYB2_FULL_48_7]